MMILSGHASGDDLHDCVKVESELSNTLILYFLLILFLLQFRKQCFQNQSVDYDTILQLELCRQVLSPEEVGKP